MPSARVGGRGHLGLPPPRCGSCGGFLSRTHGFSTSQAVSIFLHVLWPQLCRGPRRDAHSPHCKDRDDEGLSDLQACACDSDGRWPSQGPHAAFFNKYFSPFYLPRQTP